MVSGHTLKHLFAAMSTYMVLAMLLSAGYSNDANVKRSGT
jgi:hypothetical protein